MGTWEHGSMGNFELKKLHPEAVASALQKAQHYRLLNEPRQAESICRDILDVEPGHKQALITLALALTDQFGGETARLAREAMRLLEQVPDDYERTYYSGLVCERRATSYLDSLAPGTSGWAYDWYRQAMDLYEQAEAKRPSGNDDALLRWNTCARIITQNRLEPSQEQAREPVLE
ncbi:MAG: hypothetical protein ACT4O1_08140 [Gemmatimonadota bacterium]